MIFFFFFVFVNIGPYGSQNCKMLLLNMYALLRGLLVDI